MLVGAIIATGRFLVLASVDALCCPVSIDQSQIIGRRIVRKINNYESAILCYVNFHNHYTIYNCTDNLSSKTMYIFHCLTVLKK